MQQNQLPLSGGPDFERRVTESVERMKQDDFLLRTLVMSAAASPEGRHTLAALCRTTNQRDLMATAEQFRNLVEKDYRDAAERAIRVADTRRNLENENVEP